MRALTVRHWQFAELVRGDGLKANATPFGHKSGIFFAESAIKNGALGQAIEIGRRGVILGRMARLRARSLHRCR